MMSIESRISRSLNNDGDGLHSADVKGARFYQSAGIIFSGDVSVADLNELFSALMSGGPRYKLSNMPAWGNVSAFAITPNNLAVVYLADHEVIELYTNLINVVSVTSVRINALITIEAGSVTAFALPPNRKQIVYITDTETNDRNELYLVEDSTFVIAPIVQR